MSSLPSHSPDVAKPLRQDALRNREALMGAALKIISTQGPEASMESIAAAAGVGIGTLYRNFADREALIRAVIEDRLTYLETLARDAHRDFDAAPQDTWDTFFDAFVSSGFPMLLPSAIHIVMHSNVFNEELTHTRDTVIASTGRLLARAQNEGFVRPDLAIPEVVLLIAALIRPLPLLPDSLHARLVERRLPMLRAAISPDGVLLPGEPVTPETIFQFIDPSSISKKKL